MLLYIQFRTILPIKIAKFNKKVNTSNTCSTKYQKDYYLLAKDI